MKSDDAMPYFLCILLGIIIGGLFGGGSGVSHMKQEAVLKGHAEWVSDQNGKPQFKWKEIK